MHGMHARLPKHFILEERLERYADVIELQPATWRGNWAEVCWPLGTEGRGRFGEVRLDLGCGKGAFLVEAARREPDVLFLGVDAEPLCVAYAAQHVMEAGLTNAVIMPGLGTIVRHAFAPGELARIHLNFPTPYPRKKQAGMRLVAVERLLEYREALGAEGMLCLRTDSQPLRDFTLTQLELAGYEVVWQSEDERVDRPHDPTSEYEERLCAQGARVLAVWARPHGAEPPAEIRQTASLSLADYLPGDLFGDGYVPHGMGGVVTNLRNQRIRREMARR